MPHVFGKPAKDVVVYFCLSGAFKIASYPAQNSPQGLLGLVDEDDVMLPLGGTLGKIGPEVSATALFSEEGGFSYQPPG